MPTKSRLTVTGAADGFAMARPDLMEPIWPGVPETSAYIRNASPAVRAETPASLTVTPLVFNEKTAIAVGAIPAGVMRTEPTWGLDPVLPVTRRTLERGGTDSRTCWPMNHSRPGSEWSHSVRLIQG